MRWSSSTAVRAAPGFVEPCLPSVAQRAPTGPEWVYEIKHDGYRLMVRKAGEGVRIYTRRGVDWTKRFPRITDAVRNLKIDSVLIDGEGIICRPDGLADFDLLHSKANDQAVTLCAFDLIEFDGQPIRQRPLDERKVRLQRLLGKAIDGIQYNQHYIGDGAEIFRQACKLGCEGIVAKRVDLPYQSGRSKRWIKIKNPNSCSYPRPQVQRSRANPNTSDGAP